MKNPKKFNLIKKMKKKFPSQRKRFRYSKEKGLNQDNNDCIYCLISNQIISEINPKMNFLDHVPRKKALFVSF